MSRRALRAQGFLGGMTLLVVSTLVCAAEPPAEPRAPAPAESNPDVVTASLVLEAPAGCGDDDELAARIERRSQRIRIESGSAPRSLSIAIRREGEALVVLLELVQASGRRSSRTLRATRCDEALEAAALVAALSLDPTASTAPESELAPTGTESRAAEGSARAAPKAPAVPAAPAADSAQQNADESAGGRAGDEAETQGLVLSLALAAAAEWAPAPAVMPGIAVAALLRYEARTAFSPAVRLSYSHFGGSGFQPPDGVGTASVELDEGTLELCPVRLGSAALSVSPCPFVTGGRLLVAGDEALEPQSHARPWWVLGGSLLAFYRVAHLELQAGASIGIPLIRDSYQFEPAETGHVVHQVSAVAVKLGLGAGFAFR